MAGSRVNTTRALNVDCPNGCAVAGHYCGGEVGVLCRARIVAAQKLTKERNAKAREAAKARR